MKIPTREKQNEWIMDYVEPLFNLEFGKVFKNINKKIVEIQTERVYRSLRNLDENGTSWEKIEKDLQRKILSEDYKKPSENFVRKVRHKMYMNKYLKNREDYLRRMRDIPLCQQFINHNSILLKDF